LLLQEEYLTDKAAGKVNFEADLRVRPSRGTRAVRAPLKAGV